MAALSLSVRAHNPPVSVINHSQCRAEPRNSFVGYLSVPSLRRSSSVQGNCQTRAASASALSLGCRGFRSSLLGSQRAARIFGTEPRRSPASGLRKSNISAQFGSAPQPPFGSQFAPSAPPFDVDEDPIEANKRKQVSKRLERTANYFARLGVLGFWGQLICTVVAAVILAFSIVITGKASNVVTLYLTAGGIAAAFLSVFWSFGYTRLSERLRETISNPTKAPPRTQVVRNLTNGLIINLIGMGCTLLGQQATVGTLVAKALTSSATPFVSGSMPGFSPVLALDVFLVQASANTVLSHFLGMVLTLELLRAVTQSQPPPENVIPKPA